MWEGAGICRTQEGLEKALTKIYSWQEELAQLSICQFIYSLSPSCNYQLLSPLAQSHLKLAAETLNLVDIGYLIVKSALFRTESRGGHFRLDYPHPDSSWQTHTLIQDNKWYKQEKP